MNEIVTTWWTGLMMASAVIMFAIVSVHKLHEWGVYPLREMTRFVQRPWFERLLLLFFVCGMIHYGATKGTGGGSRSTGDDFREDMTEGVSKMQDSSRGGILEESGEITNLCFTGICVLTNGVVFDVAWPTNMFTDGTTLDFFAKCHALTNDWRWVFACPTQSGETNLSFFADMLLDLGEQDSPAAMFFKVQDRNSCAASMADSDGDGLPDFYELHNGTNPYVSDYANAPKLTVGPQAPYSTLGAALAASTNYSIIALSSQPESSSEMVVMPPHPVMVTGPADGYAMLHSSANIAAVLMDAGQGSETLFRNLYVVLEAKDGFQSAFWIGGNLPWSGIGASPTFENVRIRALYPNVLHYGWHYYCDDGGFSSLSNCVMNAAGSTSVIGVYAYDGPEVGVSDCVFVNFPTNDGNFATWVRAGTNVMTEVSSGCTNLSWAGYSLDANYSDTTDSDGDGLSDYEEIYLYDTDPWLADSDGDGLSDAEEVEAVPPTNPRNLYSFYRRVTVITTTSDSLADMTNYVAWGSSDVGWETNGLAAWRLLPSTNVYEVSSSEGPMYVKAYRDLNRNGQYDENADILLVEQVPPLDAVSSFVFKFGDVDGDGISDAIERQDGSDPYDGKSFRLRAVVTCSDSDRAAGVTNYLGIAGESPGARIAFSESGTLTIDEILTNGTCVINCFRDFNGNGVYDEGVDVLCAKTLTNTDNGKSVKWTVGDADGDGQSDSEEIAHGTNPHDVRNYCFNLTFIEKGVFSTTNQLTAEVLFGTNVLVGPVVMTNRTWACDLGHLVASNREAVVAHFWDDANSNGVREVEECSTRQHFSIKGHENVVTNTLALGAFDRDNDGILDHWELLHADAGLSPTNAADAFVDFDSDGLINLHEYWAGCDPGMPDGSNTVLSVMARAVDDRILGKVSSVSKNKFSNYLANGWAGAFLGNANFWLYGVESSCASPWQSNGARNCWAATLITPRHMIGAQHHTSGVGHRYWFVGRSGAVYIRQTIAACDIVRTPSTDLRVLLLDDELPTNDVVAATFLPDDYRSYIGTGAGLPMVCFDQEEKALIQDVVTLHSDTHPPMASGVCSSNNTRSSYWEDPVSGDSGNPRFLLFGDQLILVNITWYGQGFSGTSLSALIGEVQTTVDALSFGCSYRLKQADFSRCETLRGSYYEGR